MSSDEDQSSEEVPQTKQGTKRAPTAAAGKQAAGPPYDCPG